MSCWLPSAMVAGRPGSLVIHKLGTWSSCARSPSLKGPRPKQSFWAKYSSAKITLSVRSSYDAEPHACDMTATAGKNLQATLAELAYWHGAGAWSIGCWLDSGLREVPLLVVIDAKRLWAKIQAEYKNQEEGNDLHSSPHGDIDPRSCEGLLGQFRTFDCRRSDQGLEQES